MKLSMLPQSVGLLKLVLSLLCTSENSANLILYIHFEIVLCQDNVLQTWCLFCVMVDMTKLYILIPV